MSFILKSEGVVANTKLTSAGRKLLASGALTFNKFSVSDSEIDYERANDFTYDSKDYIVLRPKDANPKPFYFLKQTSNSNNIVTLSSSNVTSAEAIIVNSALERGFFTYNYTGSTSGYTLNNSTDFFKAKSTYNVNAVNGGNSLTITDSSSMSVGDYLLVNWINPSHASGQDISLNIISSATPFLFYKIIGKTGNTISFDRNIPNFNSSGSTNIGYVYCFPAGDSISYYYGYDTTTAYWNQNTISFDATCNVATDDVKVWNMNLVYLNSMEGTNTTTYDGYNNYGSFPYIGFNNYVAESRVNTDKRVIGLIHYSNNSINNYYGEGFYNDSLVLDLPTILFHKTTDTVGVKLKSDTTKKTIVYDESGNTLYNTTYYDLIINNPSNSNDKVVGKVFNDIKVIVIEDEELIASMSYKSNRNYTYPKLVTDSVSKLSNETSLFTTNDEVLYVTYLFENTLNYSNTTSYGYTTPLHCQYINKVISTGTNNSVQITFPYSDLKYFKKQSEMTNGEGYTANRIKVLMQKVANSTIKPQPNDWKVVDMTPYLNGYSTWNGQSIPYDTALALPIRIDLNVYNSGTTYNLDSYLNLKEINDDTNLGFGDEVFFFGNLNVDIQALVYRTKIVINIPYNQFNSSTNPTWNSSYNNTYISEVGIYDSFDNLVAVSKLNYPIKKTSKKNVILELDMDF